MGGETKACSKCGEVKPLDEFNRMSMSRDGRRPSCRRCTQKLRRKRLHVSREYMRRYRAGLTDAEREKARAWYRGHRIRRAAVGRPLPNANTTEQNRAQSRVFEAVKRGDMVPQPCDVCGDEQAHAHHDDYNKPLDVRWLCRSHHMLLHGAMARGEVANG